MQNRRPVGFGPSSKTCGWRGRGALLACAGASKTRACCPLTHRSSLPPAWHHDTLITRRCSAGPHMHPMTRPPPFIAAGSGGRSSSSRCRPPCATHVPQVTLALVAAHFGAWQEGDGQVRKLVHRPRQGCSVAWARCGASVRWDGSTIEG